VDHTLSVLHRNSLQITLQVFTGLLRTSRGCLLSITQLDSTSKSHSDWPSVSQSVSLVVEPHLGLMTRYLFLLTVAVLFLWGVLSDERTGLSFVYASGPRLHSLSRVWVPWESRPYFTVSGRLLLFPGSRWRYSTPSPHGFRNCRSLPSYTRYNIFIKNLGSQDWRWKQY
jgi:hypothetical protein